MEKSYKIIRMFRLKEQRPVIKTGLTLQEAQAHCKRDDTHKLDESGNVIWFDGYESEI